MTRAYRRRVFAIALSVVIVILLLIAAVYVRLRSAPEVARLLPECEGVLYANLKPLRAFSNLGSKPANWAPEYRNFVEQTGFDLERDLDEIAFAMHAPADAQHETRYSEVMIGRFDSTKVGDFLTRMARSHESYGGHDVALIPYEDRTVRVTMLSLDMIAVSNTGDPAQIDHIIDQFRRSGFRNSSPPRLVRSHYHDVPFGSLAWLITEVASAKGITLSDNISPLPFVRQLFGGGVIVGSVRYNGNVLIRADDYLKDQVAAKDRTEELQNLLSLYKATQDQTRPDHPDPDMEAALSSLKVEQKGERVQVSASLSRELITQVFESPLESQTSETQPTTTQSPTPKSHRHKRRR